MTTKADNGALPRWSLIGQIPSEATEVEKTNADAPEIHLQLFVPTHCLRCGRRADGDFTRDSLFRSQTEPSFLGGNAVPKDSFEVQVPQFSDCRLQTEQHH